MRHSGRLGVGAAPLLLVGLLSNSASAATGGDGFAKTVEHPVSSADPCDFVSSGALVFSHEQVRACYETVPFSRQDLRNTARVIRQTRSYSDLAEIYQERIGWREALADISSPSAARAYRSDFQMQAAFKHEHWRFGNAHVAYVPPDCYWRMALGFIPLDFGSKLHRTKRGLEQVLFVEEAAILPDVYAEATGIDTRALVGLQVVSVNGVDAMTYFQQYALGLGSHVDAGGGLNGVLSGISSYSVRMGGPGDSIPEQSEDVFVLGSIDGERVEVTLPWIFLRGDAVLGDFAVSPTASTEEFRDLCVNGPVTSEASDAPEGQSRFASIAPDMSTVLAAQPFAFERRRAIRRMRTGGWPRKHKATHHYEVPEAALGRGVQEIIALTDSARVVQYTHPRGFRGREETTALQLFDTVGWIDVARAGIEFACEHSERLIVDVRDNGGGNDTVIRWLHNYLFPEAGTLVPAGMLPLRVRNDNPEFNEVLFNFALVAEAIPEDPCVLLVTPGCLLEPNTGEPIGASRVDWFLEPVFRERRAESWVNLSQQSALPNIGNPVFDSASCNGRFSDENLVFVTNGSNASGGYFLPAAFKGEGIIVNTGGVYGQNMAMGRASGGATLPGSLWGEAAAAIEELTEGEVTFEHDIERFRRPVNSQMEMLGAYKKDGVTLHIDAPVEADLHVPVWTDLPGSEGFVYGAVLNAVDRRERRQ